MKNNKKVEEDEIPEDDSNILWFSDPKTATEPEEEKPQAEKKEEKPAANTNVTNEAKTEK